MLLDLKDTEQNLQSSNSDILKLAKSKIQSMNSTLEKKHAVKRFLEKLMLENFISETRTSLILSLEIN